MLKLVAQHQRRMSGFNDHVISMYARGMSVRQIQAHLLELYGTEVSPDLVSIITDEVLEDQAENLGEGIAHTVGIRIGRSR